MTCTSRKGTLLLASVSIVKWMVGLNVTEELQPIGAVWPYYEGVINVSEPQRWSMSRRLECQFLKVLHIDVTDHQGQSFSHSHAIFLLEELVWILWTCVLWYFVYIFNSSIFLRHQTMDKVQKRNPFSTSSCSFTWRCYTNHETLCVWNYGTNKWNNQLKWIDKPETQNSVLSQHMNRSSAKLRL
jgi:hypothetical protein